MFSSLLNYGFVCDVLSEYMYMYMYELQLCVYFCPLIEMDVGVVGSHVARQTAELTMQGEFTKARVKSLSAQKMLHEQRCVCF